MTASAKLERHDGVRVLILDRPDRRNAIDSSLADDVRRLLDIAAEDPDVGCLVVTGSDPAFCAGLDLDEFRATGRAPRGAGDMIRAVKAFPLPVLAAVNGAAYTGGLELVLACDFAVASEHATFADTHVPRRLMPGNGASYLLAETVGTRWTRRMSYTGLPVDAGTALRIGLVTEVVPHAELLPAALHIARAIAASPTLGVRAMKRLHEAAFGATLTEGAAIERAAQDEWRAESSTGT